MRTSEHNKFFADIFSLPAIVRHFIVGFFPEEISWLFDLGKLFRDGTRYAKGDHAELFSEVGSGGLP